MVVVESHAAQDVPFARAGRCIHIETPVLRQLNRSHAEAARGGVHQHPFARADARNVCQRVVRGEENRGHRRCLRVGPPGGDARDLAMIRDDDRSRAEEVTHHTVARREPEHIVGDLENDAGTFKADVVVRRVTERDQDVTEIHTAAAQTQTHLSGLQRALGFGPRTQGKVSRVQRAVAEGGKPPRAHFDKFSAVDSLCAH